MKSKNKIFFFLMLVVIFLSAYKLLSKSYSNQEKEPKNDILSNINLVGNVDLFTIYGRFFNLKGSIDDNTDNLSLVLRNDNYEKEFNLITKVENNKTIFQTNELINTGINLEKISPGTYIVLLKTKKNDKNIYYTLNNKTKYDNLEYYTITKNKQNNKIDIEFQKTKDGDAKNYLLLNCQNVKLPDDIYDIVIDPGHGGEDVGASKNGYYESKINLEYALKLKRKLESFGYKVKLTREKDETIPNYGDNSRVNVPYLCKAKLMLSIHQNSANSNVNKGGLEIYVVNHTDIEFANTLVSKIEKYTSSPISKNVSYKINKGVYLRTLSKSDLNDIYEDAKKNNYTPYEKATLDSTYYYMIREVGGIITNSYVDSRNKTKPGNTYYDSNHGVEAYLLELGYLNSSSNLKIILNEKDKFVEAIAESVQEYLQID